MGTLTAGCGNKCPFQGLLSATLFVFLGLLLVTLLFKIASQRGAAARSGEEAWGVKDITGKNVRVGPASSRHEPCAGALGSTLMNQQHTSLNRAHPKRGYALTHW